MCIRFLGEPGLLWMLVAYCGVSHVGGGGWEQRVSPCCCLAGGLHAGVSEKQRVGLLSSKCSVCVVGREVRGAQWWSMGGQTISKKCEVRGKTWLAVDGRALLGFATGKPLQLYPLAFGRTLLKTSALALQAEIERGELGLTLSLGTDRAPELVGSSREQGSCGARAEP